MVKRLIQKDCVDYLECDDIKVLKITEDKHDEHILGCDEIEKVK